MKIFVSFLLFALNSIDISVGYMMNGKFNSLKNDNCISFSPQKLPRFRLHGNLPPENDIESLFSNNEEDVTDEMKREILNQVEENRPSDFEVRMRLMGFTPLTVFGYAIAIIVICLNSLLGSGWLADLLGMNSNMDISKNENNNMGIPTYSILKLNDKENLLR
eukprot:gene6436-13008_t